MVSIMMFVVVIILTMFIKNITEPLQHMIEVSREISKGDLSRTIIIPANNEIAELGSVINDLASNLQEMILLSEDMCHATEVFIRDMANTVEEAGLSSDTSDRIGEVIHSIDSKIGLMNGIIRDFKFFRIER
jgi:methyl-accepting chemotaxis protein